MASLDGEEREAMGERAAKTVANWGPDRFAQGVLEALDLASAARSRGGRPTSRVTAR